MYVGRIGALAVALGIGTAVAVGQAGTGLVAAERLSRRRVARDLERLG
jgi:hypothetical protein